MIINITIDTDNPAFKKSKVREIAGIFMEILIRMAASGHGLIVGDAGGLYDSDETICGSFTVTEGKVVG